jgi:hypothetical protein
MEILRVFSEISPRGPAWTPESLRHVALVMRASMRASHVVDPCGIAAHPLADGRSRSADVVLPASVNPRADLVGGQRFGAFNCERRAAW